VLVQWIEERNHDVGGMGAALEIHTAVKLSNALQGEKFAFVGLPFAKFLRGRT
jgi:hypothetical protein